MTGVQIAVAPLIESSDIDSKLKTLHLGIQDSVFVAGSEVLRCLRSWP